MRKVPRAVEITLPDIHQGQARILNSRARFKVASCGRRFGKTLLSQLWLGLMPGGAVSGYPVAFFSPTYKYLLDVWSGFEAALDPVIKRSNKTDMVIDLVTGGRIDFWTLEDKDAGRSRKYKRVVVDEAAHARLLKESWQKSIRPTLTDYRGDGWFISTPKGINYFHDLFQRGQGGGDPEWLSFQMPTAVNPYISQDEIETARLELPELVFRQEYLAEFVTFGAGLVKPEMVIEAPYPAGLRTVMGVDLAISQKDTADYMALVTLGRDQASGRVHIKEVERDRVQFNEALNRVKAAAARHNPSMILIENNQFQQAVVQELARTTNLPIKGVRSDRDKIVRFGPLLTRYEQYMVRHDPVGVPPWFRDELLAFPDSEHDDGVDAASHAFNGLPQVLDLSGVATSGQQRVGVSM